MGSESNGRCESNMCYVHVICQRVDFFEVMVNIIVVLNYMLQCIYLHCVARCCFFLAIKDSFLACH